MSKTTVFIGEAQELKAQAGCQIEGTKVLSVNGSEMYGELVGGEILFIPVIGDAVTLKNPEICQIGKLIWSPLLDGFMCKEVTGNFVLTLAGSSPSTSLEEGKLHDLIKYILSEGEAVESIGLKEKCIRGEFNMSVIHDDEDDATQFVVWEKDRETGPAHIVLKVCNEEYAFASDDRMSNMIDELWERYIHV